MNHQNFRLLLQFRAHITEERVEYQEVSDTWYCQNITFNFCWVTQLDVKIIFKDFLDYSTFTSPYPLFRCGVGLIIVWSVRVIINMEIFRAVFSVEDYNGTMQLGFDHARQFFRAIEIFDCQYLWKYSNNRWGPCLIWTHLLSLVLVYC